jgi:hypothetical protein
MRKEEFSYVHNRTKKNKGRVFKRGYKEDFSYTIIEV